MTDPTPTRDEAVLKAADEMREYMQGARFGHTSVPTSVLAAWRHLISRLASAPAPASGRVDAVAVKALEWRQFDSGDACAGTGVGLSYFARRDGSWAHRNGDFVSVGSTLDEAKAAAQADYDARIRSALSPAATPVSEAEPVAWPAQSGGLNADWVAMVLAEDARIEDGKLANGPYLAVKIAEAADLPSEVSRLRGALANIRDHTRETSTATMALGALAKPAAGGDVEAAMKRAWLAVRGQPVGGGDGQTYVVPPLTNAVMRQIVTAALSQSTSGGRGE